MGSSLSRPMRFVLGIQWALLALPLYYIIHEFVIKAVFKLHQFGLYGVIDQHLSADLLTINILLLFLFQVGHAAYVGFKMGSDWHRRYFGLSMIYGLVSAVASYVLTFFFPFGKEFNIFMLLLLLGLVPTILMVFYAIANAKHIPPHDQELLANDPTLLNH